MPAASSPARISVRMSPGVPAKSAAALVSPSRTPPLNATCPASLTAAPKKLSPKVAPGEPEISAPLRATRVKDCPVAEVVLNGISSNNDINPARCRPPISPPFDVIRAQLKRSRIGDKREFRLPSRVEVQPLQLCRGELDLQRLQARSRLAELPRADQGEGGE